MWHTVLGYLTQQQPACFGSTAMLWWYNTAVQLCLHVSMTLHMTANVLCANVRYQPTVQALVQTKVHEDLGETRVGAGWD